MSKLPLLLISLIILLLCSSYHVEGKAGLESPTPRQPCNPSDNSGCGNEQSCALSSPVEANRVNIDVLKTNSFLVYQRKSWYNKDAQTNTYALQLFIGGVGYSVATLNENSARTDEGEFSIPVPPATGKLLSAIDFSKQVRAYYQLVFDARNGGGAIYYSCADVFLTNNTASFNGSLTALGTTNVTTTTSSPTSTTGHAATTSALNSTTTGIKPLTTGNSSLTTNSTSKVTTTGPASKTTTGEVSIPGEQISTGSTTESTPALTSTTGTGCAISSINLATTLLVVFTTLLLLILSTW
ncbi:hypothetical protein SAMD00019534_039430 [Acytostelium subglobosum LB1]|uniref:hypothetical protein n=1 Tax=Acytostelium subglobosum LB1 TaxID=1410327 RepID=UPI0006450C4D|nr:hypothetical protein SAMD00019534_039430 [Acytostelium subglobosum LB1]GAM20768.1 hypothetical protein SAMD00019534_039430 [Acytostelium subglobosum LB1]|eukprot:XP_012755902.1 hypothetical protein SAMD00019534_039430 [Acytostelium subglobosum LB1]